MRCDVSPPLKVMIRVVTYRPTVHPRSFRRLVMHGDAENVVLKTMQDTHHTSFADTMVFLDLGLLCIGCTETLIDVG